MYVKHLFVYPIKSLGGIELSQSEIDERGLKNDRRYMLVDENGVFMSQRTTPPMSLFGTSLSNNGIHVSYKVDNTTSSITIPFESEENNQIHVRVWEDECKAVLLSKEVDQFFSEHLEKKCSLVYMPNNTRRLVDVRFATKSEIVSFADAFPVLLIGSASLDDLNSRLLPDEKLGWDRFRPNVVVQTETPFSEDAWDYFSIGNNLLQRVKPCARCSITTINQQTGKAGKEPLRTLATYRTVDHKIMFGQNILIKSATERLKVGDVIRLVS